MRFYRTLLTACLVILIASPMFAQGGGGGRGGGDRGGRGGGGGDRGGRGGGGDRGGRGGGDRGGGGNSDFARRMMERMDSNGNGKLEENEVSDRARGFIEAMVRRSGKEFKLPLSISDVTGGGGDRGRGRDRSRDKKDDGEFEYPLVGGFGEDTNYTAFGVDPNLLNGRSINIDTTYDESVTKTLDRTMERYDKDKNGVLEYEEWSGIPWQSDPRESDLDSDGRLTRAEMAERYRIRNSSNGRSSSRGSDRGSSRGGNDRGRTGFSGFGGFGGFGGSSRGGGTGRGGGGGGRGGAGGRGGGDGGGGRSGFAEGYLRRYADKNGVVDFDKLDDRTKGIMNRFGIETKGKKKIADILGGGKGKGDDKEAVPTSKVIEGADRYDGQYSYRKESKRLKGMPDWWEDKDQNADSQVTLAEFLTARSARRRTSEIKDFNKFDLNRDGVITPSEAESVDE